MRKVEFLPTRDCEAGYGPGGVYMSVSESLTFFLINVIYKIYIDIFHTVFY